MCSFIRHSLQCHGKVDIFNLTINPVFIRGGGFQASKGATEKEMVTSSPVVLS